MHAHASFHTETDCTCGYLTPPAQTLLPYRSTILTAQIGSLLIVLGNIFGSVPLFRLHINPGTAQLLISIGRKLVRSSGKSAGMHQ